MTVMNEQKLVFRDMTKEERSEIVEAHLKGNAEYLVNYTRWESCGTAFIAIDSVYRTKQKQLVIPWGVIKKEYKWAAMDKGGSLYVFAEKPCLVDAVWNSYNSLESIEALNIDTTGIDPANSLTQRPDGV